jgi:hypothetical protein
MPDLIFLTESNRASFYNPNHVHYSNDPPWNKFVHSTWVHFGSSVIGPEYTDMIKRYLVLTECPALWDLRYRQAVLFFDGQRARADIPTLMFNTLPPVTAVPDVPSLVWPDFAWTEYFRDHPANRDRGLIMPGGHPNETGHEIIRDMLIPETDRVILTSDRSRCLSTSKRKKTASGWISVNAPCCVHNGESADRRQRGGSKYRTRLVLALFQLRIYCQFRARTQSHIQSTQVAGMDECAGQKRSSASILKACATDRCKGSWTIDNAQPVLCRTSDLKIASCQKDSSS